MLRLIIALFGLLFPNGLYVYWIATRFDTVAGALSNELAIGFLVEMVIATLIVAYRFHASPLGKVRVRWFVVLSLAGGIGFGIPVFYWLNKRVDSKKRQVNSKKAKQPRKRPRERTFSGITAEVHA